MARRRRSISAAAANRRRRKRPQDSLSATHELLVYQDELRAQNEELLRAQTALEESRDRFSELYDFAPNAYVTLDTNGVIVQINLTGAQLFGRPRRNIEGLPLLGFVMPESRAVYLEFIRRCRAAAAAAAAAGKTYTQLSVEVTLRTTSSPRYVQIICSPQATRAVPGLLTGLIDISERRKVEADRARIAREHAELASRLLSAQDEERQRIARDLHDNLGQQVTALRLILQVAAMNAQKEDVRSRLEQAQSLVDQLDRQLDFVAAELRSASLDLGIGTAAEHLAREWSTMFGIDVDLRCRGLDGLRFDKDVETHVYRVLQEALNNVYKHANATRVSVLIESRGPDITLMVRDNGEGFDSAVQLRSQPRGLGLVGMKERAQLAGGSIKIESAPGQGTSLTLRVPSAGRKESR